MILNSETFVEIFFVSYFEMDEDKFLGFCPCLMKKIISRNCILSKDQ